jgi:transcriptional regulator of arginine metabolism
MLLFYASSLYSYQWPNRLKEEEDMKQRYGRLTAIKELIKKNKIDNQDTLLNMLKDDGFDVTQATLSRDLKALKVGKISDGWSGYYYSLPEHDLIAESEKSYIQDVRRGVVSIEFSGNVGVVKTRSGHANSVALALETLSLPEILGTLAGDDTVLIVLREGVTKEDLLESFKSRIPETDED